VRFVTPLRLSQDHSVVAVHQMLNGSRILFLAFSDDELALVFTDTEAVVCLEPGARNALTAVFSDFASFHSDANTPKTHDGKAGR